jgi:hypothetical protein
LEERRRRGRYAGWTNQAQSTLSLRDSVHEACLTKFQAIDARCAETKQSENEKRWSLSSAASQCEAYGGMDRNRPAVKSNIQAMPTFRSTLALALAELWLPFSVPILPRPLEASTYGVLQWIDLGTGPLATIRLLCLRPKHRGGRLEKEEPGQQCLQARKPDRLFVHRLRSRTPGPVNRESGHGQGSPT